MEYELIEIGEHGAVIQIPREQDGPGGSWPDDSYRLQ